MIRPLPILLLLALLPLLGCGGGRRPHLGGGARVAQPLAEGEAIWRLRYNPPPCLADQPELHAEVETPAGWERVALESASDDADLVSGLLARFGRDPRAAVTVLGNLTNRARTWSGQHASRVFVVQQLDPPPPEEEPDDEPEEEEPEDPEDPAPADGPSEETADPAATAGPTPPALAGPPTLEPPGCPTASIRAP